MSEMILPLEQQIPSRELCERLRDAGFPQDTVWSWRKVSPLLRDELGENLLQQRCWVPDESDDAVAAPTVGEMREWLRQQHIHIDDYPRRPGEWLGDWAICPHDGLWESHRRWKSDCTDADGHALTCLALLKAMSEQPQDSG